MLKFLKVAYGLILKSGFAGAILWHVTACEFVFVSVSVW